MAVSRTVYIVDDGADYRFLLHQVFMRFLPEYQVEFFTSGDALYQHIQAGTIDSATQTRPGLILMDLNMPGLDGFQTLTFLKGQHAWKMIPVVIMSSVSSRRQIKQCYDAGANSFLIKPTEFMALKELITEICQYWLVLNQFAYS